MYVSCCHDSNIYPCFVHDRLVYRLATPTSFLKTDKPVIKSISDEAIIANNRLSISETFWCRLINSIFQNRLLLNSPPPPNECTAHFSSRLSCKRVDLCLTILIEVILSDYYTLPWIFYYTLQSSLQIYVQPCYTADDGMSHAGDFISGSVLIKGF